MEVKEGCYVPRELLIELHDYIIESLNNELNKGVAKRESVISAIRADLDKVKEILNA